MTEKHIENLKEFYRHCSFKDRKSILNREEKSFTKATGMLLREDMPIKRRKLIRDFLRESVKELYIMTDIDKEYFQSLKNEKQLQEDLNI